MHASQSVIDLAPPTIGSVIFPTLFNLVGKGSGHAQTTQDMAEMQSPGGNELAYSGTPTGKAKECLFMK